MNKVAVDTHSLSQRERALLIGLSLLLAFQGWSLGGYLLVPQLLSVALIVILVIALFLPIADERSPTPGQIAKRVLRQPLFWLGLLYFGYLLLQGLNPAWQATTFKNYLPQIHELSHHPDWPISVQAPFWDGNLWRVMLLQSSAWLMVLVMWCGLSTRRSIVTLLWVLAVNGTVIALVGIIFKLNDTDLLLGLARSPNSDFFGTFFYPNHAAMYSYLTLASTFALLLNYQKQPHSPTPVLWLFSVIIGIAIWLADSRGGLLGTLLVCLSFALAYVSILSIFHKHRTWLIGVLGITLLAGWTQKETLQRYAHTLEAEMAKGRQQATKATLTMAWEHPLFGQGAGSFQYTFPPYQAKYPEIKNYYYGNRRRFWKHAHNDWAEQFAELGLIGMVLMMSLPLCALGYLLCRWRSLRRCSLMLIAALAILAGHALVDFVISSHVLLITLSALFALTCMDVRQHCANHEQT